MNPSHKAVAFAVALMLGLVVPPLAAGSAPDVHPVPIRDDALGHALFEILPEPPVLEPSPTPPSADPYGFDAILNSYRASAGLAPLRYDPDLTAWASQNNAAQSTRGLGHHILPGCLQNCGWNQSSIWAIASSWMNSPGHRQNLLSPSATRFGIAYGPGPYWTMNAR